MTVDPRSIEAIGLDKYLDNTALIHNNKGYEDFVIMIKQGVNPTNLARIFGVTRGTMTKWVTLYEKGIKNNAK